jgi:RNA polymerase sigma-70 factor (ECF subfamily)
MSAKLQYAPSLSAQGAASPAAALNSTRHGREPKNTVRERGGCNAASAIPFEALYVRYRVFVRRSLCVLGVPTADREDMTQEVFWLASRRLMEFEGGSSLQTWLFAIALRIASNERRARRRRLARLSPMVAQTLSFEVADRPGADPLDNAIRSQAARLVFQILGELPAPKRQVFSRVELDSRLLPEVAQELGLSATKVHFPLAFSPEALRAARYCQGARWHSLENP